MARGKRFLRAFFHLPSNALVIPQKTCAAIAATVVLAAHGGGDDAAVIVHRPDDRMLGEERQRLLFLGLAIQQAADRAKAEGAVRKGDFAGVFQGFGVVLSRQAQQPLQHARSFDASGVEHRFRPLLRLRADPGDLVQKVGGAALDAVDLLGRKMLGLRAEAALLVSHVQATCSKRWLKIRTSRASQRTQTVRPRYSGGME